MPSLDLRFLVLTVINILKSLLGSPSNWDAFGTIGHLTWLEFSLLALLVLFFALTSIKIPIFSRDNTVFLHIRFGDFSATLAVSFVALLILPQYHYWFAYSLLVLLSLCSTCVLNFFVRLRAPPSIIPRLNVFLRGMVFFGRENQEVQAENLEIERQDLEEIVVEDEVGEGEVADIEQAGEVADIEQAGQL